MASEGPPPKKQALDTGQGLGQGSSSSQDTDRSLESSLLDSVSLIHQKLELCLSHSCLCSVHENEVDITTCSLFSLSLKYFGVFRCKPMSPYAKPDYQQPTQPDLYSCLTLQVEISTSLLQTWVAGHDTCLLYLGFLSWVGITFHDQLVRGSVCRSLHAAVRFADTFRQT